MGIDLVASFAAQVVADDVVTIIIDVEADQFGDERAEAVDHAICVSILDNNVLAIDPTALAQSLPKRGEQVLPGIGAVQHDVPYPRHIPRLLCLDGERQREKRPRHHADKSAPFHH